MKIILISIFLFILSISLALGQERVLKSGAVYENRSKSEMLKAKFPKISMNENLCVFQQLAIRKSGISQAEITFSFQRPCDGEKEVSLVFNDLEEALLVRNLLMTNNDYSMFNIVTGKDKKPYFELLFD